MQNTNNELVSVIVPVYKVEPYLDRCVASILAQTYPNLEVILVDDGSPDNCPALCDAWAQRDARIRVIHKKNGGRLKGSFCPPDLYPNALGQHIYCNSAGCCAVDGCNRGLAFGYLETSILMPSR